MRPIFPFWNFFEYKTVTKKGILIPFIDNRGDFFLKNHEKVGKSGKVCLKGLFLN